MPPSARGKLIRNDAQSLNVRKVRIAGQQGHIRLERSSGYPDVILRDHASRVFQIGASIRAVLSTEQSIVPGGASPCNPPGQICRFLGREK